MPNISNRANAISTTTAYDMTEAAGVNQSVGYFDVGQKP